MADERATFRPDLEGLRGAAILLVVLFHAGVRAFVGGFVGVDVFFVLSGFFITGLLLRELNETGSVDVAAFWGRRALRLLPALLVVLLVTLALVMWLYAPIDRAAIASNARAVALYSGNIEFARTATDYFGAGDNPLLHTWSLAVEEQFYLVWPLLFVLAAGAYGIWKVSAEGEEDHTARARQRLLLAIAITGVVSFLASIWITRGAPGWAFFGMPTRLWEFALGGGLWLALPATDQTAQNDRLWTALQFAGIGMIALAVWWYDSVTPYPGAAALLPALGAVALIVAGERVPASAVSRVLGTPWLRCLGRVSYAWYLWHWPLVGLGAVLDWRIGVAGKLAWSGVALVLAWLTHRFIEQSGRDGRLAGIPRHWIAPAALAASVVAAAVSHAAMIVAQRQTASAPQRTFAAARSDRMNHDCWANTVEGATRPCEFGDTRSSTVVALLGDSHAEHWLGGLDRVGRERGWKIVAMVKGGCPVADMPQLVHGRLKRIYHECTRYREAMLRRIVAMRPRAVILSSWDHYFPIDGKVAGWQVTPEMWLLGLRRTYTRLTRAGITTVAIRGTPRTWFDVPGCLSRRAARLPFAAACDYDRARALSPVAIAAQDRAVRGLPVRMIDMNDQICASPRCAVVRNGVVVFADDNHLTASFTRSLAPVLGARLAAALAAP